MTTLADLPEAEVETRRDTAERLTGGDRAFRLLARSSGAGVLTLMTLVGLFLTIRATSALREAGTGFLTISAWEPDSGNFGIVAVLTGTLLIALVAITLALPLATGTALYISEYAPPRLRSSLIAVVDLMAAVPSVVYGLWGFFLLQGQVAGVARWLTTWLGWFPPFRVDGFDPGDPLSTASVFTSSTFVAGLVVSLMVTPFACSVMREVFSQAPVGEREGALALGATRLGMIRAVVLPFGLGGVIGGTMLALGRALGETIAVFLIISPVFTVQPHVLQNGANSVSALIALRYGESTDLGLSALMAAGLALFLLTLVVNVIASTFVSRSRSGATTEA